MKKGIFTSIRALPLGTGFRLLTHQEAKEVLQETTSKLYYGSVKLP